MLKVRSLPFSLMIGFTLACSAASAQSRRNVNYDETKIKIENLPDPLLTLSGKKIKNRRNWERRRRPEILTLFEDHVYGRMPSRPKNIRYRLTEKSESALGGKAVRKQVTVYFPARDSNAAMNIILYLPKQNRRAPVFVGLNFMSNPSIDEDPAILPSRYPVIKDGRILEVKRGEQSRRWPLEEIIDAGFGVATAFCQDIEPDHAEGWKTGIRTLLKDELNIQPEEWGAIGAWAWGLSRIQDYLETDPDVDASKTVVTGHSRLGKAALWAGAQDQRFALVVSNESGEGGASLARRNYGETIRIINTSFPHWFLEKYKTYNDRPQELPADQHLLISLIAPRPIYVASAVEDRWADPKGEFLSLKYASPVYKLYDRETIEAADWPGAAGLNQPIGSQYMHYHIREGVHDMLLYDWQQYIKFARQHFGY